MRKKPPTFGQLVAKTERKTKENKPKGKKK